MKREATILEFSGCYDFKSDFPTHRFGASEEKMNNKKCERSTCVARDRRDSEQEILTSVIAHHQLSPYVAGSLFIIRI